MTEITRVSKQSIFSDLNNLVVVTTTSNLYETAFGFTEEEVFNALDEFKLSDKKGDVKAWYAELIKRGVKQENIHHYGFAFRGKEVLIDGK